MCSKNVKKGEEKVTNTSSVCQEPIRQTTNTNSHTHTDVGGGISHLSARTETPSGSEPEGTEGARRVGIYPERWNVFCACLVLFPAHR